MKAVERPIVNMRDTRHVQEGYEGRYNPGYYDMESYKFLYTSDIEPLVPSPKNRLAAIFDIRRSLEKKKHQPKKLSSPQIFSESMGVLHFFTCWHQQGRGKGKHSSTGKHKVFITQLVLLLSC